MRRDDIRGREVEDGMGFVGLAPTAEERREAAIFKQGWNAAIESIARTIERELGDRYEMDARAANIRAMRRR